MARSPAAILVAACLPFALAAGALAAPKAPPDAGTPADVGAAKMIVLGDGKGHFVAVDDALSSELLFYGDGKAFWQQRVGSGGGQGKEGGGWVQRSMSFWEPRVRARVDASFDLRDGKWTVTCGTRTTELTPLPEGEASKLLAAAKLYKPRWRTRAHALARDNTGRYFYVDQAREPEDNHDFRLFAGPKGSLRPLKMTNVVSDSQGEIFSTRTGELRLVLNKDEYVWVEGKAPRKLLPVPVEDNHVLIYTDLGVYTGQRLGTPCDDL